MYFDDKTILYFDGQFTKAVEATTNLYTQTMHYGYGVFEGIRAYETANGTKICPSYFEGAVFPNS